eukprot:1062914_1
MIMGSILTSMLPYEQTDNTLRQHDVLTLHQQNLMVYGYAKEISASVDTLIPMDVIRIIEMYINNMQLFHWNVDLSHRKSHYKSPSFAINSSQFTLKMTWDSDGHKISIHSPNFVKEIDLKYLILYFEIYCRQTNRCYKKTIKSDHTKGVIGEWYATNIPFKSNSTSKTDMNMYKRLEITTIMDVLQVQYSNKAKNFIKEVRMDRELTYEWHVNDTRINQLKVCPKETKIYSPNFGHNCWCLYLMQDTNECIVLGLQLLKHYPSVSRLNVDVVFECKALNVKWEARLGPLQLFTINKWNPNDRSYVCWTPDIQLKMSALDGISFLLFNISLEIPSMY